MSVREYGSTLYIGIAMVVLPYIFYYSIIKNEFLMCLAYTD